MKRYVGLVLLALLACTVPETTRQADLVIRNARVVDGLGGVRESATVIVDGERISAVEEASAAVVGEVEIDAVGRTLIPGLVDTHVHLSLAFPPSMTEKHLRTHLEEAVPQRLRAYLEAGITTILSTGDFWPAVRETRQRLSAGDLVGPRLLTAGPVFTARDGHPAVTVCRGDAWCRRRLAREVATEEEARSTVRQVAQEGVDLVKAVYDRRIDANLDDELLEALAQEAHAQGLLFAVHAVSVEEALAALRAGADRLVHSPSFQTLEGSDLLERLRTEDVVVATTVGVGSPLPGLEAERRTPFGAPFDEAAQARLDQLGANLRLLAAEEGLLAFGTDTLTFDPAAAFSFEAQSLAAVGLTPPQILAAATRNAARFLALESEIGTIETGKRADMVLVDGDPLADVSALERVTLVVQAGRVVVERESAPGASGLGMTACLRCPGRSWAAAVLEPVRHRQQDRALPLFTQGQSQDLGEVRRRRPGNVDTAEKLMIRLQVHADLADHVETPGRWRGPPPRPPRSARSARAPP